MLGTSVNTQWFKDKNKTPPTTTSWKRLRKDWLKKQENIFMFDISCKQFSTRRPNDSHRLTRDCKHFDYQQIEVNLSHNEVSFSLLWKICRTGLFTKSLVSIICVPHINVGFVRHRIFLSRGICLKCQMMQCKSALDVLLYSDHKLAPILAPTETPAVLGHPAAVLDFHWSPVVASSYKRPS